MWTPPRTEMSGSGKGKTMLAGKMIRAALIAAKGHNHTFMAP